MPKGHHLTGISWTHFPDGYRGVERWKGCVWNPTTGCTRVSPGCDHCYAFTLHDQRHLANVGQAKAGAGVFEPEGERHIRPDENWPTYAERVGAPPDGWPARGRDLGVGMPFPAQYDRPFSTVQLLDEQRLNEPLRWKKPRAVFVDSMSDLFHEDVPNEFIEQVFARMAVTPQHVYMILTKRPERMHEWFAYAMRSGMVAGAAQQDGLRHLLPNVPMTEFWPLPNVWLGTSVEDQQRADERIPLLLDTPAAVRFISAEPLLGPIDDLPMWVTCPECDGSMTRPVPGGGEACPRCLGPYQGAVAGLDWVLVGGESGRGHRPMDHEWVRSLRDQCGVAGVSYFGKQDAGSRPGKELPAGLDEQQFPRW